MDGEENRLLRRGDWIVLADIKTDWPDVFGPFVNVSDANDAADLLFSDPRVEHVEVQALFRGEEDVISRYLSDLDDVVSQETRS